MRGRFVALGLVLSAAVALVAPISAEAVNPDLDASFGSQGVATVDVGPGSSYAEQAVTLPGGGVEVLLSTYSRSNGDEPRPASLARFSPSGALDTTFGAAGFAAVPCPACRRHRIAVDGAGRTLVAGERWDQGGTTLEVTRLTAGGTVDTGFGPDGSVDVVLESSFALSVFLDDLEVDGSGRALILAQVYEHGVAKSRAVRLTAAGSLDPTFGTSGVASTDPASHLAPTSTGAVVLVGPSALTRLTPAGGVDGTFTTSYPGCRVTDLVLDPAGRIVMGALCSSASGTDATVLRHTPAGPSDTTFGAGGWARLAGADWSSDVVLVTPEAAPHASVSRAGAAGATDDLYHLTTAGAPDTAFSADGRLSTGLLGDGSSTGKLGRKLVVARPAGVMVLGRQSGGDHDLVAATAWTSGGHPDASFDGDGVATTTAAGTADTTQAIFPAPGGGALVVGESSTRSVAGSTTRTAVARLDANGALVTSYGANGVALMPEAAAAASTSEGALVLASLVEGGGVAVRRLLPTGVPDLGFGTAGSSSLPGCVPAWSSGRGVALDVNDATGHIDVACAQPGLRLWRLTASGSVDAGYGDGGSVSPPLPPGASASAPSVVLSEPDGSTVLAGLVEDGNGSHPLVVRLLATGGPDPAFAGTGYLLLPGPLAGATALLRDATGRLLVGAGNFGCEDRCPTREASVLAVSPSGALDLTYGNRGAARLPGGDFVAGLVPAAGGGVMAAGTTEDSYAGAWQLSATGEPVTSFSSDGRAMAANMSMVPPVGQAIALVGGRPAVLAATYSGDLTVVRFHPGPPSGPDAPTQLWGSADNGSVRLGWYGGAENGLPVTSYVVTASPGGQQTTVTTASARIEGLTNGVAYTFTVRAVNAAGSSPPSAAHSVTPRLPSPSMGQVWAQPRNGAALVTWGSADGRSLPVTGYSVKAVPLHGATPVATLDLDGEARSTTVSGLTNGASYVVTVTAISAGGRGEASDTVIPSAATGPPPAPQQPGAYAAYRSATVFFGAPSTDGGSAITSYTVTASPGGATRVITPAGSVESWFETTFTDLPNGVPHTFTVRATNASGTGPASPPSSEVTPMITYPPPPTAVVAAPGQGQATVTWSAPTGPEAGGITAYHVLLADSTPLTSLPVRSATVTGSPPPTTAVVPNLRNGTPYRVLVAAVNDKGFQSLFSDEQIVVPAGPPGAPPSLGAGAGSGQVRLTWAPAPANGAIITGYEVTVEPGGSSHQVPPSAAPSANVGGLTNGTAHTFSVVALSSLGRSPARVVTATPTAGLSLGTFAGVTPYRLLDTRSGARAGQGGVIDLEVTSNLGIPLSGVTAVVLNVTAVDPDAPGFVTVWPTGTPRPTASNLNFRPGQSPVGAYPNAVTVKLGQGRKVSLFNAVGSTHVLVDVSGYYLDAGLPAGATYEPVSPHRALDTRFGVGAPQAPVGPDRILELTVTGVGGLPATGLDSVVLNVTAVSPSAASYLTAWPTGDSRPTASNLNYGAGQAAVPNLVTVKVGEGGKVSLFNALGSVHLIADIAGYYTGAPSGATFVPLDPARLLDTRIGTGAPQARVGASGVVRLQVGGRSGVPPAGVRAAVMNVTAVGPSATSYLTAWPAGEARPLASNLNYAPGDVIPNLVGVKTGAGGMVDLYNATGTVDVLADIEGYFTG